MLQRLWSGVRATNTPSQTCFRLRCSLPHLRSSCLGSKPQHRVGADPAVAGAQAPVSCVWLVVYSAPLALCWRHGCTAWSYHCRHPGFCGGALIRHLGPKLQQAVGDLRCHRLAANFSRQLHASALGKWHKLMHRSWSVDMGLILIVLHDTPHEMLNYKQLV